jgi:hypothetical protein
MSTIYDGGPIAPNMIQIGVELKAVGGLSIRDYFAAMALQGILASGEYEANVILEKFPDKSFGYIAYLAADEMLATRKEEA